MIRPKVVGPRVLVTPMEANEATTGGVILPEEVRDKERRGIVVAVGALWREFDSTDELLETPLPINPGDVVVWEKGNGTGVRVDYGDGRAENLIVLDIRDVLLVLEDIHGEVDP